MTNSKQLIVLSGGGRKGIVKLTAMAGSAKGTCSLDFRPAGATLYLVGDDIAAVPLKDMTTTFDVPLLSNGEASCLVRSSSLTMFGGALPHSDLIKRVDAYLKNVISSPSRDVGGTGTKAAYGGETQNAQKSDAETKTAYGSASEKDAPRDINSREKQDTYAKNDAGTEATAGAADKRIPHTDMTEDKSEFSDTEGVKSDYRCERSRNIAEDEEADVKDKNRPRSEKTEERGARSTLGDIMSERDRFDGNNFYLAVKPQLDEMFVCYPEEPLLSATVECSKWVRVDAADGEYAVGILFDGDEPAFICYAVPERVSCRRPPAEIEEMCVWLPVSSRDIKGYWVIYQSAKTGEIVK